MNGPWVFGLDGGGTSSRLRIESLSGELIYRGEGSGINYYAKPREEVVATLGSLFEAAYASGIRPEDCAAGHGGNAGVDRPVDRGAFAELLRGASGLGCPLSVGNDAETALVGALGDSEGLLLVAGTGSIAYGRTRSGDCLRSGGWGHLLGDEGSAYWIASEAVSRSMRSAEGRDLPTQLLGEALAFFGAKEMADFVPLFHREFDKARIARFAQSVSEARNEGDELALSIFDEAASELSLLVASVHRRVAHRLGRRRLAMTGGLIEGDAKLRAAVSERLKAAIEGIEIVPRAADAATGACFLARALARAPE
jgi:glucosamine kinase